MMSYNILLSRKIVELYNNYTWNCIIEQKLLHFTVCNNFRKQLYNYIVDFPNNFHNCIII